MLRKMHTTASHTLFPNTCSLDFWPLLFAIPCFLNLWMSVSPCASASKIKKTFILASKICWPEKAKQPAKRFCRLMIAFHAASRSPCVWHEITLYNQTKPNSKENSFLESLSTAHSTSQQLPIATILFTFWVENFSTVLAISVIIHSLKLYLD